VTSGIGGIYPQGLSVGKIATVERNSAEGFMRAHALPSAHPERYRHFLVLLVPTDTLPEIPASLSDVRSQGSGTSRRVN